MAARQVVARLPAYLAGRAQDELLPAAAQAQTAFTLRSIWPEDQRYPLARRANIRTVEIDVAHPIEGALASVPLPARQGDTPGHAPRQRAAQPALARQRQPGPHGHAHGRRTGATGPQAPNGTGMQPCAGHKGRG